MASRTFLIWIGDEKVTTPEPTHEQLLMNTNHCQISSNRRYQKTFRGHNFRMGHKK